MANKSLGAILARGAAAPAFMKSSGQHVDARDSKAWLRFFGASNWAEKPVSVGTTLRLSTVWACVRLLSETIATLPIGLFERLGDGSREVASGHPMYRLLHSQPNADMTAVQFWEVVVASMMLWGNAYVRKLRIGGRIVALEFLMPDRVTATRQANGANAYRYRRFDGGVDDLSQNDLMHIPAFGLDGINGLSPVRMGANIFGSAMATDEASAVTFKNAMRSPGLVTMGAVLNKNQREEVRKHVEEVNASGGFMVLEGGSAFHQLSLNPQDAELLASRAFSVEEICRWFRVPPFMVGHSEKSTSWGTGIEQQMIGFLAFSLRPWLTRIEQSIRKCLLTPAEQTRYFAEFAIEGLLRADSAARASFYSTMVQNGIYTRDDCRERENLSRQGGNAAALTVQSNLLPIDQLGQKPADATAQDALKNWLGITAKDEA